MAQLAQNKRGYIRGVRGCVITSLNADGTMPGTPTVVGVKTAQEIGVETEVEEGESSTLRGGDKVLARVKDPDTIVGVKLTLKDARFDAHALQAVSGGTLVTVVEGADTRVVGWEAPTIEAQQTPPVFQAEVYAQSHDARSASEGFMKYTFFFCRGVIKGASLSDKEWSAPEFNVSAQQNPSLTSGVYRGEFVAALPAELL